MIGLGLSIVKNRPSGSSFSAQYQAVLAHATTNGWTLPSLPVQAAQNTLIAGLVADGIFTDLVGFYILATDGDRNFAKINVVNPGTYNLTEAGSPVFTSLVGFRGDNTSAALDTGFNPATAGNAKYTVSSCSFGVLRTTPTGTTGRSCIGNGVGQSYIAALSNTFTRYNIAASASDFTAHTVSSTLSFMHVSRVSGDLKLYINGVQESTKSNTAAFASVNIKILASGSNYCGDTIRIGFFGADLQSKAAALYSRVNTYIGAL